MANKAQLALENLLSMQQRAEDDSANLAKLQQSRTEFSAPSGGEAKFAAPEALATAVGAGFILGPAGGLLMGLAQGILGKREEQRAIDAYAAETGALNDVNDVFNGELDRLALTTTNPNDLEQLSALQTTKDAALKLMSSASPELQQRGSEMLSGFNTELNAYTVRQESQRIDAEAFDAQLRRELDQEQYSRFNTSHGNFRSDSEGHLEIMKATDLALNELANGTPASLWAASILVNKALDPTGVVRQEEAEGVGKLGSLWTKANVVLEKARSGQTILPEERENLSNVLYSIRSTSNRFQLALEARYADEINDIGLPVKYHDNFRLARNIPAAAPGEMKNVPTLPIEDIEKAARDAVFPFTDEGIALNMKYTWAGIKDATTSDKPQEERDKELAETVRRIGP